MNHRSREVFRHLVEAYLKHGAPIGSATLTSQMAEQISPATIRNVMQDLEGLGLLDAPHISAGRIPTHLGLRLFVDGFMEIGNLQTDLQKEIKTTLHVPAPDPPPQSSATPDAAYRRAVTTRVRETTRAR